MSNNISKGDGSSQILNLVTDGDGSTGKSPYACVLKVLLFMRHKATPVTFWRHLAGAIHGLYGAWMAFYGPNKFPTEAA